MLIIATLIMALIMAGGPLLVLMATARDAKATENIECPHMSGTYTANNGYSGKCKDCHKEIC